MNRAVTGEEYRRLLQRDFASFARRSFRELNPQTPFSFGWHIEVIAAKLAAVRQGKIRRLIINLPPRHLKSLLASIAFPAWCLGHDPSAQILCVSYAQELADKLARDCRSIMMSPWYRRIFPTRLAPHRQAVQEFVTTRQGYRLATSNGGVLTGRGADIILIDDPLKPEEALSEAQRQAANEWFDHTLYSRLNDKRSGAIVIIMQRLHEDDLVGHVLAQEPWEVVCFPAIAEADEVHRIETIWGPRMLHAPAGRGLASRARAARHPRPHPPDDRRIQFRRPVSAIPAPLGGGLVKAEWFKRYGENERPERFERIVQSWDTANKATELSDFSVCTTWGSQRQEPLSPRRVAPAARISGAQARGARAAEPVRCQRGADRGQGLGHPADPGTDRRRLPWRHPLPADCDKIMRLHAQTAMIENGFVYIPETAPWLAEYLHEMTVFPKGKHDDQVDSTAQFLDWFKRAGSGPTTDAGIWHLYRQRAEELGASPPGPEPLSVMLKGWASSRGEVESRASVSRGLARSSSCGPAWPLRGT